MAKLKAENVEKCVSILKGFIDDSPAVDKEKAILALEQLQKITAGMDMAGFGCDGHKPVISVTLAPGCQGKPKVDGAEIFGPICASQPKAHG
jgi:hypothetical protein